MYNVFIWSQIIIALYLHTVKGKKYKKLQQLNKQINTFNILSNNNCWVN